MKDYIKRNSKRYFMLMVIFTVVQLITNYMLFHKLEIRRTIITTISIVMIFAYSDYKKSKS